MDQKGFLAAEQCKENSPGKLVRPKQTHRASEQVKSTESMNVEGESQLREESEGNQDGEEESKERVRRAKGQEAVWMAWVIG